MHSPPAITSLLFVTLFFILSLAPIGVVQGETKCWKRKYYVTILGTSSGGRSVGLNTTVSCPQYYSWTISDYCCYDGYDRFDTRPFCCYSETYKLAVAVGLICLVLLGISCSFFLCWLYNVPHYLLSLITCGKFSLNDYMKKSMLNGPYVDPSFYTGEPFWSSANAHMQPYPLRPMPPGIFYPTGSVTKTRWSNQHFMSTGQMPLFVVASRQFTRNPYSARPNDRQSSVFSVSSFTGGGGASGTGNGSGGMDSRRSSTTSNYKADNRVMPTLNFRVNIDEVEAAAELLEALKRIENKDKSFAIPKLVEETQNDLDLDENEGIANLGKILDGSLDSVGTSTSKNSNVGTGKKDSNKKQAPRGAPAVPTSTSVSVPGSRRNSVTTTRIGSSTKIVPIKSRRDRCATGKTPSKMKEDDEEKYNDDSDSCDDDDEDEESMAAKFVVPVKATILNELGSKIPETEVDNKYALESVEVQEKSKEKSGGKAKAKATTKTTTTLHSGLVPDASEASPSKKDIPGLITEVGQ